MISRGLRGLRGSLLDLKKTLKIGSRSLTPAMVLPDLRHAPLNRLMVISCLMELKFYQSILDYYTCSRIAHDQVQALSPPPPIPSLALCSSIKLLQYTFRILQIHCLG